MDRNQFNLITEPLSARYDLVHNAEVHTYPEGEAAMDTEMFSAIAERYGKRFIGAVEGLHYRFKPATSIPSGSVAVPRHNHRNGADVLLIRL
jgi:hypothetical protein